MWFNEINLAEHKIIILIVLLRGRRGGKVGMAGLHTKTL